MIIWIASYPKSGNTWVRALLGAYLYSQKGHFEFSMLDKISQFPSQYYLGPFLKNLKDFKEVPKYWIHSQNKINSEKKINFLKTHNAMCSIQGNQFTNKKNTLAVIYVVRDPRNIITSLSNHYNLSINEAFNFFTNKRKIIFMKDNKDNIGDVHFIGDWADHYKSWNLVNFAPTKIIKYEDLLENTEKTFVSILDFLNQFMKIDYDNNKINNSVKSTTFNILRKKEEIEGFPESIASEKNGKKINFFNLGKENSWRKYLSSEMEEKIKKVFNKDMLELGYIN